MKDCTVNERRPCSTGCFDSFLEHGASRAVEGVRYDRGGNEMIRMKDHHVMRVIYDTSAIPKVAYDMDVGSGCHSSFKPPVPKVYTFDILGLLSLNKHNLSIVSSVQDRKVGLENGPSLGMIYHLLSRIDSL